MKALDKFELLATKKHIPVHANLCFKFKHFTHYPSDITTQSRIAVIM